MELVFTSVKKKQKRLTSYKYDFLLLFLTTFIYLTYLFYSYLLFLYGTLIEYILLQ